MLHLKKTLQQLALTAACIATCASLLGFIPGMWFCDVCSQLRVVYAILFLFAVAVLYLTRLTKTAFFFAIFFAVNAFQIANSIYPRSAKEIGSRKLITLLNFNTENQSNKDFRALRSAINQRKPDLIALVEVDRQWTDNLSDLIAIYPYTKIEIKPPGIALYSKFPIEESEVKVFGESKHPRIYCKLRIGSNIVSLVLIHPPTPRNNKFYAERNAELEVVGHDIKLMQPPVVLVGDFNCGPWSSNFFNLLNSGLVDSERGFMLQPSWPARTGRVIPNIAIPPLIPIDHVLISPDVIVLHRDAGPPLGSDHLPVFVELGFPIKATNSE